MLKASSNFQKSNFNKASKPYWSKGLTIISKHQKQSWHAWRYAGKPREADNVIYRQYKEAKKQFRSAQRAAEKAYQMTQMEEIIKASDVDQRFF
jgi:hypothetical protein